MVLPGCALDRKIHRTVIAYFVGKWAGRIVVPLQT